MMVKFETLCVWIEAALWNGILRRSIDYKLAVMANAPSTIYMLCKKWEKIIKILLELGIYRKGDGWRLCCSLGILW